jgi:hypothetical protein
MHHDTPREPDLGGDGDHPFVRAERAVRVNLGAQGLQD